MKARRLATLVSVLALVALALPADAGDRRHGRHRPRSGGHVYVYPSSHWGWGFGWGWGPYWWGGPGWGSVYLRDGRYGYGGRFGIVDTDVEPEEAGVYLDGVFVGTADDFDGHPDFLYLRPGTYKLEFRHPGFETLTREIEVSRGERVHVEKEMKLASGRRKLDFTEPSARRGTPLGRVFGPGGKPVVGREDAGDDDDEADRPRERDRVGRWDDDEDREEAEETAEVAPRAVERVPEARAEKARVRFEVKPEDAAVYVDDRYEGSGDELSGRRGILLEAGKRTVTVVRPGYEPKTVEVEATAGKTVDVVVELARK